MKQIWPAILALSTIGISQAAQAVPGRLSAIAPLVESVLAADGDDAQIDWTKPLTLEFKGGTVAQYIAAIQSAAAASGGVNIVSFADLSSLPMPEVRMKEVTFMTAMDLLSNVQWADDTGRQWALTVDWLGDAVAINRSDMGRAGVSEQRSEVWSIEQYQPAIAPEDILSSVEVALAMLDGKANVRYHADTGLLIVRGTVDQLNAVQRILKGLEDTKGSRNVAAINRQQAALAEVDMAEAQARLTVASHEHAMLQSRLETTRKMRDAGNLDDYAVQEAELQVAKAEGRMQQCEADIQRAQIKIKTLTEQIANPSGR